MSDSRDQEVTLEKAWAAVCGLCIQSKFHNNIPIKTVGELFLPPLRLGQFRIWEDEQGPSGFVVWAYLSKDVANKYKEGHSIQPHQWQSGKELWFINFVSRRGSLKDKIRSLYNIFPNHKIGHILRQKTGRVGKFERIQNVE